MKFNKLIKSASLSLVALLSFTLLSSGLTLAAWAPARTTFTSAVPATYVTFNSITDNPQYGDERAFLDVRDINSTSVADSIAVNDGETLVVRVYYHNNAAANLNLVATNTRVRVALPTVASTSTYANAHISASNANPGDVSDTVDFTGPRPFTLEYIAGSAQIWNGGSTNGQTISDSVVTTGALIGYNAIDGNLPGCAQYSGYVTLKLKVHMPTPKPPVVTPVKKPTKPVVKHVDKPKELPNTGSSDVLGTVAAVSVATGAGYYIVRRRQLQ